MISFRRAPSVQPSFDGFLFASIGRENHSMPISVLSLFSRLDLDPAMEARNLLMLPKPNAAERLAQHILALPGNTLGDSEAKERADYLVLLLPRLGVPAVIHPQAPVTFGMLATAWLCSMVAIMAITLVTQWAGNAWHRDSSAPIIATDGLSPTMQSGAARPATVTRDLHSQH